MPSKPGNSSSPASALSSIGKVMPKNMTPKKVTVKVKAKFTSPKGGSK